MVKIFLTGATGFIGGDLLYTLAQTHPEWDITCIVRTQSKADQITASYPKVRIILGDNNSSDLLAHEAARADITYHTSASDDDIPSAQAIAHGLSQATSPRYWIHTSGGLILARETTSTSTFGQLFTKVYTDSDAGISELVSTMPDDSPHRDVDKLVLAAGSNTVKTAIVCPAVVYGVGRGPMNKHSWPIWASSMRNSGVFGVGAGENIWHYVHVRDLSMLYVLLGEAAVSGKEGCWGDKGYYLAENGKYVVKEMLQKAALLGVRKGLWEKEEVQWFGPDDADQIMPRARVLLGACARGVGVRAKEVLGWKPEMPMYEECMGDVMNLEAEEIGFETKKGKAL